MHRSRKSLAQSIRDGAAQVAADRPHPRHVNNKEEFEYRDIKKDGAPATHIANYTKGLPHDVRTGLLLNPFDYKLFVQGIQSGNPADFQRTPLGPAEEALVPDVPSRELITSETQDRSKIWRSKEASGLNPQPSQGAKDKGARVRAWESAGAGNVFDLEGPDAQAVTMPPAPRFESDELLAEIVEVYAMALLRDEPFVQFPRSGRQANGAFKTSLDLLCGLDWFQADPSTLPDAERSRHRRLDVKGANLFRGQTPGEDVGPYLSQFLLLGNNSLEQRGEENPARTPTAGFIGYGALGIQQKVRIATPEKDYLTVWEPYIDVQNGADLRGRETYVNPPGSDDGHRFIATPRDLSTYVHYDALYEAYLNACLFLLTSGAPFDRGIPFLENDVFDKQQGFAHFGGPHILTLVTEVATRALKAVRYQKFNIHRRLRPEALGGRLDRWFNKKNLQKSELLPLKRLAEAFAGLDWGSEKLTDTVIKHNFANNQEYFSKEPSFTTNKKSYLLPMAFPEGSPMHPAYGAGHATVAGACVTILKAYFDHGWTPPEWIKKNKRGAISGYRAYEPSADGNSLQEIALDQPLTVEGELNKLAANISIGRNWAGVHYYTDYIESIRMGEQIAIGLLEEQKLTYPENFTMTVPLYDGGAVRI